MKTIKVMTLAAILATALVFANLSPAEAKKASTDDRLSPKSFGPNTYQKLNVVKTYDDKSDAQKFAFKKVEHLKSKLKLIEAQKALEYAKKTYKS